MQLKNDLMYNYSHYDENCFVDNELVCTDILNI